MSVYLDYNATTPMAPSVIRKIHEALENLWGNPSSAYSIGKNAKSAIAEARCQVARMICANSEDIIFTSGGTEANNMVVFSVPSYHKTYIESSKSERRFNNSSSQKPHVITTNVEHDATILPLKYLQKKGDIDLSVIPVNNMGHISVQDIISQVQPQTCLVTVMHANNETGVIMPIADLGRALKKENKERIHKGLIPILYHSDAAQTLGKVDIDVEELQVDFLTIVGHKFYGPRIGALYIRNLGTGSHIQPVFYGGGQEKGWRPGTENTPMIVGLGEAARLVCENIKVYNEHMHNIRNYLEEKLMDAFGKNNVVFNSHHPEVEHLPNTCNVSLKRKGLYGHLLLSKCHFLMASVGAACHSQNKPSKILLASGVSPEIAANAIRMSVGRDTTKEDIVIAINDLKQAVETVTACSENQESS